MFHYSEFKDGLNAVLSREQKPPVYRIPVIEEARQMAMKVVHLDDCCSTSSIEAFKILNNSNIVRMLYSDQDDQYRYFGMELCVASLDQIFLPEGHPYKYHGPMPTEEHFCYQVASGLGYLQKNRLVHGSIKPSNILISSDKIPQIKLSDFGLKRDVQFNQSSVGNWLQDSRCWLAPEILQTGDFDADEWPKSSIESKYDVFATGNVFFYFSSRGFHLFGENVDEIISNTTRGHQINLFLKLQIGHFVMGLVRWMTQKDWRLRANINNVSSYMKSRHIVSNQDDMIIGDDIKFSSRNQIGCKGVRSTIYLGFAKGLPVAVKVVSTRYVNQTDVMVIQSEINSLMQLNHPNFIKLFNCTAIPSRPNGKIYLTEERCLTSLHSYCKKALLYRGTIPMPKEVEVLLQMAEGLEYIHGQNLIYRDVNPRNALISYDHPHVIKWADFGLYRDVYFSSFNIKEEIEEGTKGLMSPELAKSSLQEQFHGSIESDIFALGCTFFFYLVPGENPFSRKGNSNETINIMNNDPVNLDQIPTQHFAYNIVTKMIAYEKESRLKLCAIIEILRDNVKRQ